MDWNSDAAKERADTLIQDLPGRPTVAKGIPHSGAMDPLALSIANMLVANDRGVEGLEITLSGPELRFLGPAVVALCGAPMEFTLDGDVVPMWTRKHIKAGQRLKIGKTTGGGCRAYLSVHGGFRNVAEYFGSKSTSPVVAMGGYQGRALAPGDLLSIVKDIPRHLGGHPSIPEQYQPKYTDHWDLMVSRSLRLGILAHKRLPQSSPQPVLQYSSSSYLVKSCTPEEVGRNQNTY